MAKKKNLYVETWRKYVKLINMNIKKGKGEIQLGSYDFTANGERKAYSFNLKIENCVIPEKEGSAVARDLKIVLDKNSDFQNLAKGKVINIKLNQEFILSIKVQENTLA